MPCRDLLEKLILLTLIFLKRHFALLRSWIFILLFIAILLLLFMLIIIIFNIIIIIIISISMAHLNIFI